MSQTNKKTMEKPLSFYLSEIQRVSGFTQSDLARELNTTQVTVNSWINNRSIPRSPARQKIELLYFEHVGNNNVDESLRDTRVENALALHFPLSSILANKELLDRLVVHFTYNTNSIEGSTMTYDDTHELLIEHHVLKNRTIIEQTEARNHQATFLWLLDSLSTNSVDFSHKFLCDIHLHLMNAIRSDAGTYRNHAVRISGSRTVTANFASIPKKLDALFKQMNNSQVKKENVISHISKMHAEFERIHPFADGNGRVGRLLMLELAIKHNVIPPLVTRAKRSAYYAYLEQAQTKEHYVGLEYFIASAMVEMGTII